jgi:hypothetical protein
MPRNAVLRPPFDGVGGPGGGGSGGFSYGGKPVNINNISGILQRERALALRERALATPGNSIRPFQSPTSPQGRINRGFNAPKPLPPAKAPASSAKPNQSTVPTARAPQPNQGNSAQSNQRIPQWMNPAKQGSSQNPGSSGNQNDVTFPQTTKIRFYSPNNFRVLERSVISYSISAVPGTPTFDGKPYARIDLYTLDAQGAVQYSGNVGIEPGTLTFPQGNPLPQPQPNQPPQYPSPEYVPLLTPSPNFAPSPNPNFSPNKSPSSLPSRSPNRYPQMDPSNPFVPAPNKTPNNDPAKNPDYRPANSPSRVPSRNPNLDSSRKPNIDTQGNTQQQQQQQQQQQPSPERCKDPCVQGLSDKLDGANGNGMNLAQLLEMLANILDIATSLMDLSQLISTNTEVIQEQAEGIQQKLNEIEQCDNTEVITAINAVKSDTEETKGIIDTFKKQLKRVYNILGGDSWFTGDSDNAERQINSDSLMKGLINQLYEGNSDQSKELKANNLYEFSSILFAGLSARIGLHRLPVTLPKQLHLKRADIGTVKDEQEKIATLVDLQSWQFRQTESALGSYPLFIKYKDKNNAEKEIEVENIAEAISEMIGLMLSMDSDTDFLSELLVKTIGEQVQTKTIASLSSDYLKAISDFLGFKYSIESKKMPISIDPRGKSIKEFMKDSEVDIQAVKITESNDNDIITKLNTLIVNTGILKAAIAKKANPTKLEGDAIRDDLRKQDTEFDEFVQFVNNMNPILKDKGDPTPKVRDKSELLGGQGTP